MSLNLDLARKIIKAMIRFSIDNYMLPGTYAVTDSGGHVIAIERRDSGLPATIDLAIDKEESNSNLGKNLKRKCNNFKIILD
ncbi:MAG: heme-binding protein [Caldisphaera sp.]